MKRNDIVETASKVIGSITGTFILVHPGKLKILAHLGKLRILVHLEQLVVLNTLSFKKYLILILSEEMTKICLLLLYC